MSLDAQVDVSRDAILSEAQLPCGRRLQNRLVKAAMYEHLGQFLGGPPNDMHFALYSRWATGSWGMVVTGNVQVAGDQLGLGRDVVAPAILNEDTIGPFRKLASAIHGDDTPSSDIKPRTLAVMQISHTGRQSPNFIGGRFPFVPPKAPSAVPMLLKTKRSSKLAPVFSYLAQNMLFQTPQEMSLQDVDIAVGQFVKTAELAVKAGFDGVQVHAAHGYLVTQFLSQKSNVRTDEYSAKTNPLKFLHRIVSAIRTPGRFPQDFVVGVKLNAADYVDTGNGVVRSEDRALEHLNGIASWGMVDFIEISGGDYDTPDFLMDAKTSRRQAAFAGFSQRAMQVLTANPSITSRPLIMLTGGLNSTELMSSALSHNHTDLLGIARQSVLQPELPKRLAEVPTDPLKSIFPYVDVGPNTPLPFPYSLERSLTTFLDAALDVIPDAFKPEIPSLIGAGTETARFSILLRVLARGQEKTYYTGEGLAINVRFWWYLAPGPWPFGVLLALAAFIVVIIAFVF